MFILIHLHYKDNQNSITNSNKIRLAAEQIIKRKLIGSWKSPHIQYNIDYV